MVKHINMAMRYLLFSLLVCLLLSVASRQDVNAASTRVEGAISLGGFSYLLDIYYDSLESEGSETVNLLIKDIEIPENVGISNVEEYVHIREGAGTNYGIVGYLPAEAICIIESVENGWAKITSGSVSGYVNTDYLFIGEEAVEKARELNKLRATVTANVVNFRSEPSTDDPDNVLAEVNLGEMLNVIDETVLSKDDTAQEWVKVYVDDMEGYVVKQFVDVAYDWAKAISIYSQTAQNSETGISALRAALIAEAQKHLGLRYVWGGESLSNGADCSGFCRAVYKACGIDISNIPRSSSSMAASSAGRSVSYAEAKAGDLVFYGSSSGHVNHVALYMGNGQIIHESGYSYGCRISDVGYRRIIKIKNFLD